MTNGMESLLLTPNTSGRPPSRRVQATAFRAVNVPMRAILRLPVPTPLGKRLMLVHHTGRRTGRDYRQPVSYVRHDDVLLSPGGGNWTRNLRDGEPTRIRLRGRDITVRPDLIEDPDEVEGLLAIMTRANPSLDRFVRIPRDTGGRLDRGSLEMALAYGFRIVRWHPDSTVPS